MRTDGSVAIGVNVNSSKADKDLAKLKEKIEDATEDLDAKNERKGFIQKEFEDAKNEALKTETVIKRLKNQIAGLRQTGDLAGIKNPAGLSDAEAQLREQEALLRQQNREAERLGKQYEKITDEVNKATDSLGEMQAEAGDLQRQIDANSDLSVSEKLARALDDAMDKMERFEKRLVSLVKSALIFNVISMGLREVASYMGDVIKTNDKAMSALGDLKGALLTLAQPLLDVVIPAFTQLVNILAKVVSYAAAVVSALFGKTSDESAEAAEEIYNEAEAVEGVGDAAEEASKALAGFDEINRLASGTAEEASKTDGIIPNFKAATSAELPLGLRLSIEDVFFDGDVTGETIAERAIAVLGAVCGAATGFVLGGVPGALIGSLLGLMLGLVIDSLTFDHDGKLSKTEVLKSIVTVLIAVIGGVIGFHVGGFAGAAIGATIGLSLTAIVESFALKGKEKLRSDLNEELNGLLDEIAETTEYVTEARVRIKNITGDIAPEDQAKLDIAQQLVDEIFEIDAKDNKTAQEIDVIKQKIEQLNALKLDGIQLTFDETTGHVVQTKTEVNNLLKEIKKQYQLEALHDAYVELYTEQYNLEQKRVEALKEIEGLQAAVAEQEAVHAENANKYNEALRASRGKGSSKLADLSIESQKSLKELEALQDELSGAEKGLAELDTALSEAKDKLSYFDEELQRLNYNMEDWVSDSVAKMKDAGANIVKSLIDGMGEKETELSNMVKKISGIVSGVSGKVSSFASGFLSKKSTTYATQPNLAALEAMPIPRLAQGAVIPPNREFLAVLGDQPKGYNIEAPASLIKQMVAEALRESGSYGAPRKQTVILQLDRRTLGQVVYELNGQETQRIGLRLSES